MLRGAPGRPCRGHPRSAQRLAKSDQDERKRSRAIAALEGVDAKSYPEAATLLADITLKDPQPHVRMDAMSSLARMRPMSAIAAHTLEKAAESDSAGAPRAGARRDR